MSCSGSSQELVARGSLAVLVHTSEMEGTDERFPPSGGVYFPKCFILHDYTSFLFIIFKDTQSGTDGYSDLSGCRRLLLTPWPSFMLFVLQGLVGCV